MNLKPNVPGTIFDHPTLSSEEILLLAHFLKKPTTIQLVLQDGMLSHQTLLILD